MHDAWVALALTLKVAGWATALNLVLGVAVGYAMARWRFVGRELADLYPPKATPPATTTPALRVQGVSVPGWATDVSFEVRPGEILGFAGLVGAGRTELFEGIMGLRSRSAGSVELQGRAQTIRNPRDAVRLGLTYLSEDRKGKGLHVHFGLRENLTLMALERYATPWLQPALEDQALASAVDEFGIRTGSPENAGKRFDQGAPGLHHACFRLRDRAAVDAIHEFLKNRGDIAMVHGPQEEPWAPGYYSILFEDPDGIRIEFNHVPGVGLLAEGETIGGAEAMGRGTAAKRWWRGRKVARRLTASAPPSAAVSLPPPHRFVTGRGVMSASHISKSAPSGDFKPARARRSSPRPAAPRDKHRSTAR
eukprot:gene46778-58332_t